MRLRPGLLALLLGVSLIFTVLTIVEAQQAGKVYRIGWLALAVPTGFPELIDAFRRGMREHGYVEGHHFTIELRGAGGDSNQLARLAAEFVELKVDVMLVGSNPAVFAAKRATTSIPIVMVGVTDPVENGIVRSLARPGTNITGFANIREGISRKWLDLVRETRPRLSRVVVLSGPGGGTIGESTVRDIQRAASELSIMFHPLAVRTAEEIESVFRSLSVGSGDVLIVVTDPNIYIHRGRIAELATDKQIPAIYSFRAYAESGGLMSYGPDFTDLFRRAAGHVDRILKGANPRDLPIERPIKFELVINLKTAKALGLTIPPSLLLRADQVIE